MEFKREGASTYDALIQAMDYTVWCSENFEWIEKTIRNTGNSDPIQRDIRIMVVASEFDERIKNAARALEFDIQFVSFGIYEHADNTFIVPRAEPIPTAAGAPLPPKTKEQHFSGLSDRIVRLYEKFEDTVKRYAEVDANYQPQGYIGIRFRGTNFVSAYPKRDWIRLDIRLTPDEARTNEFVGMSGDWGYFHLKETSFDQAMQLVDVAYKKISERKVGVPSAP